MRTPSVVAATAALILLGWLGGCSRDIAPAEIPEIVVPVQNDIQTLDPAVLSDPTTSRIVWQLYEGLVGLDQDDEVKPVLAESWSASDDFRVWRFRIRHNVRFHKNASFARADSTRTLNAADVAYSYKRFAKGFGAFVFAGLVEGFDNYVQGTADDIEGFVVSDSMTFEVRLVRPDRSFINRLTSPYLGIMPREVVEASPDAFGREVACGTGPFMLAGRGETEVTLTRNPEYWGELGGNLEKVAFRVEKNPQFLVSQLQSGTYGLAQLPLAFYPTFFENGQLAERWRGVFQPYSKRTYNVTYVGIDVHQVQDPVLRLSMAKAVDRSAIVDRLLYGQAELASSPVPSGMLGYVPPLSPGYERDSASAMLARSSYAGRPLKLLVSDAANSEQIGEFVQSAFRDAGIDAEIEKVDFNTLISRVFGGSRPDLFVLSSEWIFSAPEIILETYDSRAFPNPNMFGFADSTVDALLADAQGADDRAEINAFLQEAEARALQAPPALWLYHLRNVYLMDHRLSGFWVDAHNQWHLGEVRWSNDLARR